MDTPPPMDSHTVVQQSNDLVACDLDGEVVMLSLETGTYYGLDDIGSRIWALLAQPLAVEALCARLAREYAVEPTQCRTDVLAFLQDLASDHLVHIVHAPAP